jgi:hypothetical protein
MSKICILLIFSFYLLGCKNEVVKVDIFSTTSYKSGEIDCIYPKHKIEYDTVYCRCFHKNGNIRLFETTNSKYELIGTAINYDSLGTLLDSMWFDDRKEFLFFRNFYPDGYSRYRSYFIDNYADKSGFLIEDVYYDSLGEIVQNKSEYVKIFAPKTIQLDSKLDSINFELLIVGPHGKDSLIFKVGNYNSKYKLIDSTYYKEYDLHEDELLFFHPNKTKGKHRQRFVMWANDNSDTLSDSTFGKIYYLYFDYEIQ